MIPQKTWWITYYWGRRLLFYENLQVLSVTATVVKSLRVRTGLMTVHIWRTWLWTHHDIREMSQTKAPYGITLPCVQPSSHICPVVGAGEGGGIRFSQFTLQLYLIMCSSPICDLALRWSSDTWSHSRTLLTRHRSTGVKQWVKLVLCILCIVCFVIP